MSGQNEPTKPSKTSSICQALLKVRLPINEEGEAQDYQMHYAKIDSCSSADICSARLLHNIKSAQEYGRPVIRMKQAHGKTPWYDQCGELLALDEHDRLMRRIYYVQATPVHGDNDLILTGMNTILDLDIDIKHHMKTSIMPGIRRLRRGKPVRLSKKRKKNPAKGEPKPPTENFIHFSEASWENQEATEFKNKFDPLISYKGKLRAERRHAPSSTKKRPRSLGPTLKSQADGGPAPTVTSEECYCQPRVAQSMSYEECEIFINSSEELPNKEAVFPKWVKIMSAEKSKNPPVDSLCFMT